MKNDGLEYHVVMSSFGVILSISRRTEKQIKGISIRLFGLDKNSVWVWSSAGNYKLYPISKKLADIIISQQKPSVREEVQTKLNVVRK